MGVFKNPPIPKNLISLSPIIIVCECQVLWLVGFSYIKREQSTQFISLWAQALISHLSIKGMCTLSMLHTEAVQYYLSLWLALIMNPNLF